MQVIKEDKQREPDAVLLEEIGLVWLKLSSRLGLAALGAGDVPPNILWLALPPPTDGEVVIRHARDLGAILHQVERYGGVPLYKNHTDLAPRLWFSLRAEGGMKENVAGQKQITAAAEDEDNLKPLLLQQAKNEPEDMPKTQKSLMEKEENSSVKNADQSSPGPFSPRKNSVERAGDSNVPGTPVSVSRKRMQNFTPPRQSWPKTHPETIVIDDDDDDNGSNGDGHVQNNHVEDVDVLEEADEVDVLMDEVDSQVFPLTVEAECMLWQKACCFFGHDPAACDPQNPAHRHRVAGLRLGLRPDQMWSVFRMLAAQPLTGLHGTLLADGFGLGKTLQATAVAVLAALVHMAKTEVEEEWAMDKGADYRKQQRRHLPPSKVHPQTITDECPSGTYRLGFACPCVERLPTHDIMNAVPGPGALFIVPPGHCRTGQRSWSHTWKTTGTSWERPSSSWSVCVLATRPKV